MRTLSYETIMMVMIFDRFGCDKKKPICVFFLDSISRNIENKHLVSVLFRRFLYKEHLYKELEAEKGSKNKEFLRN